MVSCITKMFWLDIEVFQLLTCSSPMSLKIWCDNTGRDTTFIIVMIIILLKKNRLSILKPFPITFLLSLDLKFNFYMKKSTLVSVWGYQSTNDTFTFLITQNCMESLFDKFQQSNVKEQNKVVNFYAYVVACIFQNINSYTKKEWRIHLDIHFDQQWIWQLATHNH